MIAHRFRTLGWVALIALAATSLYLISLQVAAERGKLEAVERQITAARHDMRQLQTELGTRASMRQLERWNSDVLALSSPKAVQFARSGAQLASLNLDTLSGITVAKPPSAMLAAAKPEPKPKALDVAPQHANYIKPAEAAVPKLERIAMIETTTIRDVRKIAAAEQRTRP